MKKIFNTLLVFVFGLAVTMSLNGQTINFELAGTDSFGDGWNGGYLTVTVGNQAPFTFYGPATGNGPTYAYFSAQAGDQICMTYTGGSWDGENDVVITNTDVGITVWSGNMQTYDCGNGCTTAILPCITATVIDPSAFCAHDFYLYDTWGDGWGGILWNSELDIYVDGAYFTSITLNSGSFNIVGVPLPDAADIDVIFSAGWIWAYECYYEAFDAFGNLVASGGPNMPNGYTQSFTAACPQPCGVELLSDVPASVVLDPGLCETVLNFEWQTTGDCQQEVFFTVDCLTGGFDYTDPDFAQNDACGAISGDACSLTMESLDPAAYGFGGANTCTFFGTILQWTVPGDGVISFDYSIVNESAGGHDWFGYSVDTDWSGTVASIPNLQALTLPLNSNDGDTGSLSINVSEGDHFALICYDDSYFTTGADPGAIFATITNFQAAYSEFVYVDPGTVFQGFQTVGIGVDQVIEYCTGDVLADEYCFEFEIDVYEYPNAIDEIACNDNVQVAMGPDCAAFIGADLVLEGGPYGCYDNYTVVIEGVNGQTIYTPGVYTVGVYDANGNNCWSTIEVVDKMPPSLVCEDQVTACYESVPYVEPTVFDNCGNWGLSSVDVVEEFDCNAEYQAVIHRFWTVTDYNNGMTATCVQNIYITRATLEFLTFPLNWDGLAGNYEMIECSDAYPVDFNGNPHPDFTGWPGGTSPECGTIEVFYNDINYTSNCGPKILREWTVIDDCTAQIVKHTQIIRITDSTAPIINVKGEMLLSTSAWSCDADYVVPAPNHFYDNCDANPWWYVEASAGEVVFVDGHWFVLNMPEGVHVITYFGVDWCGNTATADHIVTVVDQIPPIAVCEQFKQTSLTFDGSNSTSKIWAWDFDSGSHDAGCGPVWFKVLRNDQGCADFNADKNTTSYFDDYAMYCCEDVGVEGGIMTTLRVYDVDPGPGPIAPNRHDVGGDLYGHFNDCWTMVTVEEKVPPQMICHDVTITCEENYDPDLNPGVPYPTVFSTCGNYTLEKSINTDKLSVCGIGTVVITWEVFVNGESKGKCKQNVEVVETTPFDYTTIVFPYITSKECLADPTGGDVEFETNPCNVVDAEIVNIDTFRFVDDACYKILIDWVVIDWCVYEPNTGAELNTDAFKYFSGNKKARLDPKFYNDNPQYVDGYYKFTEVLMVYDQTPANIVVADTCLGTATCLTPPETYEVYASSYEDDDDCGGIYHWQYVIHDMATWNVVQYSHNNDNYKGNNYQGGVSGISSKDVLKGTDAKLVLVPGLPEGTYRVLWTLDDGCSNTTQAYQYIEVADKKPPTPFMVDIATALMSNGMVEMDARFFDKGACNDNCLASYDNCSEILYFTFTPVLPKIDNTWSLDAFGLYYFDPASGNKSNRAKYLAGDAHSWNPARNTSGKVFTCDDAPSQYVDIYVWDKFALNEDCDDGNYDFATVFLNINDDGDCTGNLVNVAGMISANHNGEGINNVTVIAEQEGSAETKTTNSVSGAYAFDVQSGNYTITPEKRDDYSNGVTTLDLVLIQKHLLGLVPLAGDDLIAADANASASVTAGDLFELRELILGVKDVLDNNDSWVFVPGSESIQANADMTVDFGGIKVGDVNGSAVANFTGVSMESRTANTINLVADEASVEAGLVEVSFTAENFANVYGAQFTMNVNGMTYAGVEGGALNVSNNNFGLVRDGVITMSWNNANGVTVADGTVLFTLKLQANANGMLSNMISVSSDVTAAEAYTTENLDINNVTVTFRGAETVAFELFQNEPNPFTEETVIGFNLPEAANYTLTIFDVTGKVVKVVSNDGQKGFNNVTIDRKDISSGVMYYQLESNDYTATKKMIIIE